MWEGARSTCGLGAHQREGEEQETTLVERGRNAWAANWVCGEKYFGVVREGQQCARASLGGEGQ